MSEIEKIKLYQNAGIEPTYTDECIIANRYWNNEELANEYGTFDKFMEKNCKFGYQDCTDECEYAYTKTHYPPFTAEKQLELIKWLNLNDKIDCFLSRHNELRNEWVLSAHCVTEFANEEPFVYPGFNKEFNQALAMLINYLWQDLTEEEKQQVKGILE